MTIPEYDEPYRPTLEQKREELVRWALLGDVVGVIPGPLESLASRVRQAMAMYRKFKEQSGDHTGKREGGERGGTK